MWWFLRHPRIYQFFWLNIPLNIYIYFFVYMYTCMYDVYTKKPSALQLLPVLWLVEVKILRMPAVATPTDVQRKTLSSLVIPLILLIGIFGLLPWVVKKKLTCLCCYIGNQTTIQFYNMDHNNPLPWYLLIFWATRILWNVTDVFFSLLNFVLSFLMIQILNPKSRSFAPEGFLGHGVCWIKPSRCK